ncbi:MAG: Asp-tRNA(Asn)/Glu-tRNA(Gln) amidotransferase subunit GatB [Saprospiraceae bacterium]|nr:Asp-tRNA(Asn)/Glu-tRNA(Gln) amidotransferase subunit GatB [Saprospiraceae bacterium]
MKETPFEIVVGLEVHIQLNSASKAFSSDVNSFNLNPNTHISPITLALPGTLPRANKTHIEKAIKLSLALDAKINRNTRFDRKNYFYPDLPKGYQVTQDKYPIGVGGQFSFISEGEQKHIRIHHLHMEEDAGKSSHDMDAHYSLIDYNRAGTPLIELVTEPDFRSGQEVFDFLTSLQQWIQYLDISDGNMEEGSIRCDCNVSIRPKGSAVYGERCEIKNVNSRRFAKQAIQFEAERQLKAIVEGVKIERTTMLFDSTSGETRPMRRKETENDYRYFPEPDLCPFEISEDEISAIRASIDWLPHTLKAELISRGITDQESGKIGSSKAIANYFLNVLDTTSIEPRELANLLVNKLIPLAEEQKVEVSHLLNVNTLIEFTGLYTDDKINKSDAYATLLAEVLADPSKTPTDHARRLNLMVENQDFLDQIIQDVLLQNTDKVTEYRKGKTGLLGFFMGQVKMKASQAVNPQVLKEKVEAKLKG